MFARYHSDQKRPKFYKAGNDVMIRYWDNEQFVKKVFVTIKRSELIALELQKRGFYAASEDTLFNEIISKVEYEAEASLWMKIAINDNLTQCEY